MTRERSRAASAVPVADGGRRGRILARISGFAGATILTGAVNAAAIPALIMVGGLSGWTHTAVGQAVGAIGSVAIGFGWAVSGAATVAVMSAPEAEAFYRRSVAIRGLLAVPVVLVAALAGWIAVQGGSAASAASAAAYSLNGLTAAWWFIGTRAPRALILRETVPKVLGVIGGVLLVAVTHQIVLFPVGIAAGCIAAAVVSLSRLSSGRWFTRADVTDIRGELRMQLPSAVTSAVSTAYLNVPTIAVATLAPQQLAVFAIADRLFRLANTAVSPLIQTLQGWIPHPDPDELSRRIRTGLRVAFLLGVVVALAFALLASVGAPLISAGKVGAEPLTVAAFAVTLLFVLVSQVSGLSCLVSLGRVKDVARSAVLGAVVGLPVVLGGTLLLGASGAVIGEAIAEGAVTVFQISRVRRYSRRLGSGDRMTSPVVAPVIPLEIEEPTI